MRIVSLLASGTEIVQGLGLGEQLVGISHECDFPPDVLDKPRVSKPRFDPTALDSTEIDRAVRAAMAEHGAVYELDRDRLRELAPDLILTQAVCEVCAVPTSMAEEATDAVRGDVTVVSLDAHDVAGVFDSIRLVAEAAGVPERGARYEMSLKTRVAAVEMWVTGAARPRVLALEWLAPPFAPGHWTPEMIRLAGGESMLGTPGKPSRPVDWDELVGLDPDIVVVMPCGYDLARAAADADRYEERLVAVATRAVDAGRAFVVDGSAYFNRSGPRLVDGIEILAALFHPERFADYDLGECAAQWRPTTSPRASVRDDAS